MALVNVIKELKDHELREGEKILSLYLNTDRSECQNGSWKIRLKNGLKKLQNYIELSVDEAELKNYNKLMKKVEKTVFDSIPNFQKSLVIFASNKGELFTVHFLQLPVETDFYWEGYPELHQIELIQKEFPSCGVIVAHADEIIIINTALGEMEVANQYKFDDNSEDWRKFEGAPGTEKTSYGANHRAHYQERIVANQQRWIRNLLPLIEEDSKKYEWKHVYIIGKAEYLNNLENELKLPIKYVLRKTFSGKELNELIYKELLVG